LLAVATAYQDATGHHKKRPPVDEQITKLAAERTDPGAKAASP